MRQCQCCQVFKCWKRKYIVLLSTFWKKFKLCAGFFSLFCHWYIILICKKFYYSYTALKKYGKVLPTTWILIQESTKCLAKLRLFEEFISKIEIAKSGNIAVDISIYFCSTLFLDLKMLCAVTIYWKHQCCKFLSFVTCCIWYSLWNLFIWRSW